MYMGRFKSKLYQYIRSVHLRPNISINGFQIPSLNLNPVLSLNISAIFPTLHNTRSIDRNLYLTCKFNHCWCKTILQILIIESRPFCD